jgi:hypothetical protein
MKLKVSDDHVRTNGARRGYLYLCNRPNGRGGAQAEGPWIDGSRWDYTEKLLVDGSGASGASRSRPAAEQRAAAARPAAGPRRCSEPPHIAVTGARACALTGCDR